MQRDIHGDDRRRSVLELSDEGYRIYDEVVPMALGCEQRLIASLSASEVALLDSLLDRLMASVDDMVEPNRA